MSFLKSIFGKGRPNEKQMLNITEVYRKFLVNYGENPSHEFLEKLTIEAGEAYYGALQKNGEVTEEDKQAIKQDLLKAIKTHEDMRQEPFEEEEMRNIYENYMKNEADKGIQH